MFRVKMWASFEVTAEIACADLFLEISIISGWIEGRALVMRYLDTDCAEQLAQDELSMTVQ